MVRAVFVANLLMALLALGLCAHHAWPRRDRLAFLGVATVYGVILEQLVIVAFEAYEYPVSEFILTVWDVPVVIGLGWAAIIYTGHQIGRRLSLSPHVRPVFVALFALHVDLAIDAVAIRVPFWQWTPPGAWFGVSLGNFLGWYLVAFCFSGAWLLLAGRTRWPLAAPALGAIPLSVAGLVAGLEAWTRYVNGVAAKAAVLLALIGLSLAVVAADRPTPAPIDWRLGAVPLAYHGFYLVVLVAFEMYREQPLLPVVSVAMLVAGLVVHAGSWPRVRTWLGGAGAT